MTWEMIGSGLVILVGAMYVLTKDDPELVVLIGKVAALLYFVVFIFLGGAFATLSYLEGASASVQDARRLINTVLVLSMALTAIATAMGWLAKRRINARLEQTSDDINRPQKLG